MEDRPSARINRRAAIALNLRTAVLRPVPPNRGVYGGPGAPASRRLTAARLRPSGPGPQLARGRGPA